MIVRVAAFARIREILGASVLERRVGDGASAEDVWRDLSLEFPALTALRSSTRLALDGGIIDGERALADGDELALLPPFGGG